MPGKACVELEVVGTNLPHVILPTNTIIIRISHCAAVTTTTLETRKH